MVIENIYGLENEICKLVSLTIANRHQFELLSSRISMVVNTIRQSITTELESLYFNRLQEVYEFLKQILVFIKQFIVSGSRWLILTKQDYSLDFQNLNKSLLDLTKSLNLGIQDLMFDMTQVQQKLTLDLMVNQALIDKNNRLLKSFLEEQLRLGILCADESSMSSIFLSFEQLNSGLKRQLRLSTDFWDQLNDNERYELLRSLNLKFINYEFFNPLFVERLSTATLISRFYFIDEQGKIVSFKKCWDICPDLHLAWIKSLLHTNVATDDNCGSNSQVFSIPPSLESSLPSPQSSQSTQVPQASYKVLNEQSKVQLSAATSLFRGALAELHGQIEFSAERYWNEYPELHALWLKIINKELRSQALVFSSLSQHSLFLSDESQNTSQEEPSAKKLKSLDQLSHKEKLLEEQGFSLLLLKIPSPQNIYDSMTFFVGLDNHQAERLQELTSVTELDFKQEDIIDLFDGKEEISEQKIDQIKDYFKRYFIPSKKTNHSLKM